MTVVEDTEADGPADGWGALEAQPANTVTNASTRRTRVIVGDLPLSASPTVRSRAAPRQSRLAPLRPRRSAGNARARRFHLRGGRPPNGGPRRGSGAKVR